MSESECVRMSVCVRVKEEAGGGAGGGAGGEGGRSGAALKTKTAQVNVGKKGDSTFEGFEGV